MKLLKLLKLGYVLNPIETIELLKYLIFTLNLVVDQFGSGSTVTGSGNRNLP